MKILITGGAGLIGSAIAKAHLKNLDSVFIWDNKSNKFNNYSSIEGNDVSSMSLEDAIAYVEPDIISHQASSVGVGESQYEVSKYCENNLVLTSRLVEYLIKNKTNVKRIIHAGSMGPYGEGPYRCNNCKLNFSIERRQYIEVRCLNCGQTGESLPISEDYIGVPQSIYALTKKTQEEMLRIYSEMNNPVNVVSLRYFSVYDTKCNPNNPFTGVLSIIANKAINSSEITLNEDGTQTRDLVHAEDIGHAHIKAAISHLPNKFEAFNIGTGVSLSMGDIANNMASLLKTSKPIVFNHVQRHGDIKHSCANIDKAKHLLGWVPNISIYKSMEEYAQFVLDNWLKFEVEDTCKQADLELIKYKLFK